MQQVPQSILSILDAYHGSSLEVTEFRDAEGYVFFRIVGIDTHVRMWTDVNNVCRCMIERGYEYYGTGQGDTPEFALQSALSSLDKQIERYQYRDVQS